MNKPEKFDDYLREQHAKQYEGFDDDMPDAYDDWLQNLESEDWLEYGDKFKTINIHLQIKTEVKEIKE